MPHPNIPLSIEERFWQKVEIVDDTMSCWLWRGAIDITHGRQYGRMRIPGTNKTRQATALAWEIVNGPIPRGLVALQKCGMSHCCRNDGPQSHVYIGKHPGNRRPGQPPRPKRPHRSPLVPWECPQCYCIVMICPSEAKRRKFCSRPCKLLAPKYCQRCKKIKAHKEYYWAKSGKRSGYCKQCCIALTEGSQKINLDILYERDNRECQICHKKCQRKDASRDHVIPRSEGGEDSYQNCVLAHLRCNTSKGNRHVIPQQQRLFG